MLQGVEWSELPARRLRRCIQSAVPTGRLSVPKPVQVRPRGHGPLLPGAGAIHSSEPKLLPDLDALDAHPWTGHARLLGADRPAWQATEPVLERFGGCTDEARRAYRRFIEQGWNRPAVDLDGGGLHRSRGGSEAHAALRRGREAWAFDERILGGTEFVQRMLVECTRPSRDQPLAPVDWQDALRTLGARAATRCGVEPIELRAGNRRANVSAARALVAYAAVCEFGITAPAVATFLGVTARAVRKSVGRGRALAVHLSFRGQGDRR